MKALLNQSYKEFSIFIGPPFISSRYLTMSVTAQLCKLIRPVLKSLIIFFCLSMKWWRRKLLRQL